MNLSRWSDMLHPRLSRLGLCALIVCSAPCADLPIVRIIIGPDGAQVERAGIMPDGDEVVDGLPLGIDPSRLTVTIDGVTTPPAIRLELPTVPPAPVPDAAWKTRMAEAQAAFDLAQPTIELAEQRIRLSRAVLRLMPGIHDEEDGVRSVVDRPDTAENPVPSAAIQKGLLQFVSANREQAEKDIVAAKRARGIARDKLIALDQELEQKREPTRFTSRLPLPGSGGRRVQLRYAVERAAWAPIYSIEVNKGQCTLVREALIDVPRDQQWTTGQLELITRSPAEDLVLKDLQVPVLELGDELVTKRISEKRRSLMRTGGSHRSQSSVDVGLHSARGMQLPDGSWPGTGSGKSRTVSSSAGTALAILSFLGAGYDHKTPNKYKTTVISGLSWLTQHVVTADLASQALTVSALAEAYAMTNDQELREPAQRALLALSERVIGRQELEVALYRRGPFVGPEALGWVTLAAKSSLAAGLGEEAQTLMALIKSTLPELVGHSDSEEAAVVRLFVSAMSGMHEYRIDNQPPVSDWIDRSTTWWREGRPELVYFASLGLFQYGGSAWELWNGTIRDRLVELSTLGARRGFLSAAPHPAGEAVAMSFITLPLQVYYRYKRVGNHGDHLGDRKGELFIEELKPLPPVLESAKSWPVRINAGPAHLMDGQRMRVQIDRIPLPGKISLRAVPASGPGAWRALTTTNPLSVPLLTGAADVVVDGERLGDVSLPFCEPGQAMHLHLGRDDRIQVTRSEERTDNEAWGKRTRTYTTKIQVDAPPGLYDSIRIDEAMPLPKDGSIQLVSLDPAIAPVELDRRLIEDPIWHLDLDLRKPPVEATIKWQLRFPATVRPRIDRVQGDGTSQNESYINNDEVPIDNGENQ